jgi:hypothetical protein
MPADDMRLAATIKTTLSGALMAAAFGVIAVEAALVVFVVDKRQDLNTFTVIAICAAVAIVASAAFGAKGIATVYKTGHTGAWAVDAGKGFFVGQALTGGLGLVLLITSTFCGSPKPEPLKEPPDYQALKARILVLEKAVTVLQTPKALPTPDKNSNEKSRKKRRR